MSTPLIALVLFAAILHAGWNAMAKSGGSPLFSIAAYRLVAALISLCLIGTVPLPPVESWPFIIASTLIHTGYYFTLAQTYRHGDLSLVYPLFRGAAPILVALGAAWLLDEWLSLKVLSGILMISIGLMSLVLFGSRQARITFPMLAWTIATSVLIAAYTIADGAGVRTVQNSLSYILWLFVFESLPICLWLMVRQREQWLGFLTRNRTQVLLGGLASSAAYGIVIHAMGLGAIAAVSSLRETSVIFAAIIGAALLKEPFGLRRTIAAIWVTVGIIIIRYFS